MRWDIELTVLVAIAIFVHELGHLLAMKLCRYKNLKMMFLPLIGAAASGCPSDYDSGKIAVISLLGPVIGYASCCGAVALWFFTEHDILLDYAFLAVILNAFNLLPVIPLDGGHFLNETLFARLPAAELLFIITAIVGLVILALTLQAWILIIPAFFLFAAMFSRYRIATTALGPTQCLLAFFGSLIIDSLHLNPLSRKWG